jgi:hypothetical protein
MKRFFLEKATESFQPRWNSNSDTESLYGDTPIQIFFLKNIFSKTGKTPAVSGFQLNKIIVNCTRGQKDPRSKDQKQQKRKEPKLSVHF